MSDHLPFAELRERVCEANRGLVEAGLVVLAFGNASGIDRARGVVAIKPSGSDYAALQPEDIVVVDLADGRVVDGRLRPSSDTPAHLALYRAFERIGGVVHTHSSNATAWAQAGRPIPCLGTTHADHFRGDVPVSRPLTEAEIAGEYELNTGRAIVEWFATSGVDPEEVPGCLAVRHGPFVWGPTPEGALEQAIALEHVAGIALSALAIAPDLEPMDSTLRDRHHRRKHGADAYYGQADRH
jgi:L-ribulose-5-phosphate 4-epimerase